MNIVKGDYMYVMGIVNSRRLGRSLGLDIIGADGTKRCNFNCVYCEVGNGKYVTERGVYADFNEAIKELKTHLDDSVDVITFSGNGEPTLNEEIGEYIDKIHSITDKPVCVITNSTTLHLEEVKESLLKADIVMPSIDSCIESSFKSIDRPLKVDLSTVKQSILEFSKQYDGKLYLEILFVKGYNDSNEDINELLSFVKEVNPTELHINTVDRVPAEKVDVYSFEEKKVLLSHFEAFDFDVKIF